jgi:hypothetical protein
LLRSIARRLEAPNLRSVRSAPSDTPAVKAIPTSGFLPISHTRRQAYADKPAELDCEIKIKPSQ